MYRHCVFLAGCGVALVANSAQALKLNRFRVNKRKMESKFDAKSYAVEFRNELESMHLSKEDLQNKKRSKQMIAQMQKKLEDEKYLTEVKVLDELIGFDRDAYAREFEGQSAHQLRTEKLIFRVRGKEDPYFDEKNAVLDKLYEQAVAQAANTGPVEEEKKEEPEEEPAPEPIAQEKVTADAIEKGDIFKCDITAGFYNKEMIRTSPCGCSHVCDHFFKSMPEHSEFFLRKRHQSLKAIEKFKQTYDAETEYQIWMDSDDTGNLGRGCVLFKFRGQRKAVECPHCKQIWPKNGPRGWKLNDKTVPFTEEEEAVWSSDPELPTLLKKVTELRKQKSGQQETRKLDLDKEKGADAKEDKFLAFLRKKKKKELERKQREEANKPTQKKKKRPVRIGSGF